MIWVAELGSMHKGSTALALEMARQAAQSGATIVKMQFGHDPHDKLRHVGREMAFAVTEFCHDLGVEFMASIFSHEGLELARECGMERYKIAHQKVDDADLVAAILMDGKETFVSRLKPVTVLGNVRQIFTTDDYPTLKPNMPHKFGGDWYGYSDHCLGIEACLLAIARGALYVEKHFCLSKDDLCVRDTPLSATPVEFAEMVRLGEGIGRIVMDHRA